jgi:hypothetical protein
MAFSSNEKNVLCHVLTSKLGRFPFMSQENFWIFTSGSKNGAIPSQSRRGRPPVGHPNDGQIERPGEIKRLIETVGMIERLLKRYEIHEAARRCLEEDCRLRTN